MELAGPELDKSDRLAARLGLKSDDRPDIQTLEGEVSLLREFGDGILHIDCLESYPII